MYGAGLCTRALWVSRHVVAYSLVRLAVLLLDLQLDDRALLAGLLGLGTAHLHFGLRRRANNHHASAATRRLARRL